MNYERWAEEFPPLQRGVLAGAASAGARLVVLDNLYAYGPPRGRRLVETMAADPTSTKSATRAAMTEELLRGPPGRPGRGRHRPRVGLLRSRRDPVRPRRDRLRHGAAGKTAQVMGDPDQPHSYSYTPDVAAGADHARHRTRRDRRDLAPAGHRDAHHPPDHRGGLRTRRPQARACSPPVGRRCARSDCSSRRCANTCTPSTSSPTPGSSTTASSAPPSATSHARSTRRSPPPSTGTATAPPSAAPTDPPTQGAPP